MSGDISPSERTWRRMAPVSRPKRGARASSSPRPAGDAFGCLSISCLLRRSLQVLAPASEHSVHRGGADDRLERERKRGGVEDERPGLGAAEPSVERDELLEGAALVELRV